MRHSGAALSRNRPREQAKLPGCPHPAHKDVALPHAHNLAGHRPVLQGIVCEDRRPLVMTFQISPPRVKDPAPHTSETHTHPHHTHTNTPTPQLGTSRSQHRFPHADMLLHCRQYSLTSRTSSTSCSSAARAWQLFPSFHLCGRCSCVGAISQSARLAGTAVVLI